MDRCKSTSRCSATRRALSALVIFLQLKEVENVLGWLDPVTSLFLQVWGIFSKLQDRFPRDCHTIFFSDNVAGVGGVAVGVWIYAGKPVGGPVSIENDIGCVLGLQGLTSSLAMRSLDGSQFAFPGPSSKQFLETRGVSVGRLMA